MKRILAVFFNCNSVIRIMITALLAAASQPLIAWSMAGLSGAFLENDLIYVTVFRNILILLLALFIAWFADNSKANLLLDSEFELRRQVFDSNNKVITISSSRGCPYGCSFCSATRPFATALERPGTTVWRPWDAADRSRFFAGGFPPGIGRCCGG